MRELWSLVFIATLLLVACSTNQDSLSSDETPTPTVAVPTTESPPAVPVLSVEEASALYFEASCAANEALSPAIRLLERQGADDDFYASDYLQVHAGPVQLATEDFRRVLTSSDYRWPSTVEQSVVMRATSLEQYGKAFKFVAEASRDELPQRLKRLRYEQQESTKYADAIRTELSIPPSTECPQRESELRYEIYCGARSEVVRYTDVRDAWEARWPSGQCTALWLTRDFSQSEQQSVSFYEGLPFKEIDEASAIQGMEYALARCSERDIEAYDYLDRETLDSAINPGLAEATFAVCPDHPLAKKVSKWIDRIKKQSVGGRSAFGQGLHRVGVDIKPGTYVSTGNADACYWERIDEQGRTIDNGLSSGSRVQFTVRPSDFEVKIEFCEVFQRAN